MRPKIAVLLFVFLASVTARAEPKKYIAILQFDTDATVTPSTRETLEESVRNYAADHVPGYTVLDGKTQIQVLIDNGLDPAKACEGNCALDTARKLNAEIFLSGSIRKPGKLYRAFVRCYYAKDGSVAGSIQIKGETVDELIEQFTGQGAKLFGPITGETGTQTITEAPRNTGNTSTGSGHGFLTVIAQPKASIALDGEPAGTTPLRRKQVDPGTHLVVLTAPGKQAITRTIEVPPGGEATVSEVLLGEAGAVDVVVSPEEARVTIDGKSAKNGRTDGLSVGSHRVHAEMAGYKPLEQEVTVENGVTARAVLQLDQLPGRVVVSSNIVATCLVEGASSAEARPDKPAMIEAPPGARLVTCKRSGYADYSKTVEVRGGKPSLVQAVLRESRGGEVRTDPKSGLEYVKMPAGSFNMGCVAGDSGCQPNEVVHRVTMNEFWVGKTPATQESYNRCVNAGVCNAQPLTWDNDAKGCNALNKRLNHPANCLNFDEATQYCTWVGGRLPTSEEWEYTAKGGEDRIFPWGNDKPSDGTKANICDKNCIEALIPANREKWKTNKWVDFNQDDGWGLTSPVGTYPRGASKYGVLDMAGNLWEWTGSLNEGLKEVRGGSWSSNWIGVRTSFRGKNEPNSRFDDIGVRCVMDR